MENSLTDINANKISYEAIRKAMQDEPYKMSLVGEDADAVHRVVNVGIDSHLEACFIKERGDSYEWGFDTVAEICKVVRLTCTVSIESFPTLVRRLFEEDDERSQMLANDMLLVLGFKDDGTWAPRED